MYGKPYRGFVDGAAALSKGCVPYLEERSYVRGSPARQAWRCRSLHLARLSEAGRATLARRLADWPRTPDCAPHQPPCQRHPRRRPSAPERNRSPRPIGEDRRVWGGWSFERPWSAPSLTLGVWRSARRRHL